MSKHRRGNYVFISWIGDHSPHHVHVFCNDKLVLKWDLDNWCSMKGKSSARIVRLLQELRDEGAF